MKVLFVLLLGFLAFGLAGAVVLAQTEAKPAAPAAEAPKVEAPKAGAPAEAPKVETPKAAEVKLVEMTGKVVVEKDAEGILKSASLVGEGEKGETVAIMLDFRGRTLARTEAERVVTVSGVVTEINGTKTISVRKFASVAKPVEPAPAK